MAAKEKNEKLKPKDDRRGLKPLYLLFGVLIAIIAGIIGFLAVFVARKRYRF